MTTTTKVLADITRVLRIHGYTDFQFPDLTTFDEATLEGLVAFKKETLQADYDKALTAHQKPTRSIDKLNAQVVALRPTEKTSEQQAVKNEQRIATLMKEIDGLRQQSSAKFHDFFAQRLVEEAFRGVPYAYETGDWSWVESHVRQVLLCVENCQRDGNGNYIR